MIFCVEDDTSMRELMLYALKAAGLEARGFASGAELSAAMKDETPALIMLDIMLPGQDGLEILRRLKANPAAAAIPVIMATAKGSEYDTVLGLDTGADDYLAKPFGMMEMVSRVKAVLRRARRAETDGELRSGPLAMNLRSHTVTAGGAPVTLTLKEYELLRVLLEAPGAAFTREQLLVRVWGAEYAGETRTVDVHIGTLRNKLGRHGSRIATVRGVGYRLEEQP